MEIHRDLMGKFTGINCQGYLRVSEVVGNSIFTEVIFKMPVAFCGGACQSNSINYFDGTYTERDKYRAFKKTNTGRVLKLICHVLHISA